MARTEGAGANRVRRAYRVEPSELGALAADLLDELFQGLYHVERQARRVDWTDTLCIQITLRTDLATWDFAQLTRLVFLCHDYCLRGELSAAAFNYIRLRFHRRERTGGIWQRHPTLEEAVTDWRQCHHDIDGPVQPATRPPKET